MTVKPLASPQTYTFGGIRKMLGLSRHAVTQLIELGFVDPARDGTRAYRFSFRDIVLLRSAHALRGAGIPTRQILRSLRRLKDVLPPDAPISRLRITASGDRVTVSDSESQWEPETGQLVMDFSVTGEGAAVSFLTVSPGLENHTQAGDAERFFRAAEQAEEEEPARAESLYRQVLSIAPDHARAYLNLGFMLCESQRPEDAVVLYDRAVLHCAEDPLVHYNRAVALTAVGRASEALSSYESCLELEPDLADAHENAAMLYAQAGRKQLAIRHFNEYRRLQRKPGSPG